MYFWVNLVEQQWINVLEGLDQSGRLARRRKEAKNLSVGLTVSLKTAAAGEGTLQVVLRH